MNDHSVRGILSHDPFYRRLKDAVLLVLAIIGGFGFFANPSNLIFRINGKDNVEVVRDSLKSRIDRLESSLDNVNKKVDKMDDKIDRILESQWHR